MIQWPGRRDRWRKAGEATEYFPPPPPEKCLSALKPKHPDKGPVECVWGNHVLSRTAIFMSFIWPVEVSYAQSPWESAKLQLQIQPQPRTWFYTGLWHGLALLREPLYQKYPLPCHLLVIAYHILLIAETILHPEPRNIIRQSRN